MKIVRIWNVITVVCVAKMLMTQVFVPVLTDITENNAKVIIVTISASMVIVNGTGSKRNAIVRVSFGANDAKIIVRNIVRQDSVRLNFQFSKNVSNF